MIEGADDLVTQIAKVSEDLGVVQLAISSLLTDAAGTADAELDARTLRDLAYGLLALAGDLTSFGIELARRADELT